MQNKPNLPDAQIKVSSVLTKDYENKRLRRCVKTNPIQTQYKPNTKPIQTQFKPNSNPIQSQYKPNSNPIKPNGGGGIRTPVPRCFKTSFYMHSRFIIFFASLSAKRQARKLAISVFLAGVGPNNRLGQSAI